MKLDLSGINIQCTVRLLCVLEKAESAITPGDAIDAVGVSPEQVCDATMVFLVLIIVGD